MGRSGRLLALALVAAACGGAPPRAAAPAPPQLRVVAEDGRLAVAIQGGALFALPRGCGAPACATRIEDVQPAHTRVRLAPFLGDPELVEVLISVSWTGELVSHGQATSAVLVRGDGTPACRLSLGGRSCSCTGCMDSGLAVIAGVEGARPGFVTCRSGLDQTTTCVRYEVPRRGECGPPAPVDCGLEVGVGERAAGSGRAVIDEPLLGDGLLVVAWDQEAVMTDDRGRAELSLPRGRHRVDVMLGLWRRDLDLDVEAGEDVRLTARVRCRDSEGVLR